MTHEEEYIMLCESNYAPAYSSSKIGSRCSGIGAMQYEYIATYISRFGMKEIYGSTLRDISYQLDNNASPAYNERIRVDKVERYGGEVVNFYTFVYDPRKEHWVNKGRLRY